MPRTTEHGYQADEPRSITYNEGRYCASDPCHVTRASSCPYRVPIWLPSSFHEKKEQCHQYSLQ